MEFRVIEDTFLTVVLIFSFISCSLYFLSFKNKDLKIGADISLFITIFSLLGIIINRSIHTKYFPLSNFFEAYIFMCLGLIIVYLILEYHYKTKILNIFITLGVFILTIVCINLPEILKIPKPLTPALQSNWLYVHVSLSMLSYALFTLAFICAIVYLITDRQNKNIVLDREKQELLNLFNEIIYILILNGLTFLILGIITGSIWAENTWGSYWNWDPKEIWALITCLFYSLVIHIRNIYPNKKYLFINLSIIGILFIIFTYYGVNYIKDSLHSYGI